ncbi:hypothetical protein [Pseudomonas sp. TWP3-1]|uniref:hypothetical protein n=1 Tax=Pseudomonas sp. TWP3-1 TaxID=2804631 RepID=UPI003CE83478
MILFNDWHLLFNLSGTLIMTSRVSLSANVANRGDLDVSFGDGGKVHLLDEQGADLEVCTLHVLGSGNVLCAAYASLSETTYVAMLDVNGNLDARFGNGGLAKFKLSDHFSATKSARPFDLQVDEATQTIVVGFCAETLTGAHFPGLAKLDLAGKLDGSFGKGGLAYFNYFDLAEGGPLFASPPNGKGIELEFSGAMTLLSNGTVMLSSCQPYEDLYNYGVLANVLGNGDLDTSFHEVGYMLLQRNGMHLERIESLVPQGSNFLLAATTHVTGEGGWFLVKFDANGKVATDFGSDGYYDQQPNVKKSILFRDDTSKIYLSGTAANAASQHFFLVVQRRGADGEEDPDYGDRGWTGSLGGNGETEVFAARLYNPGSTIVVAARQYDSQGNGDAVIGTLEQSMGWQGSFGKDGIAALPEKNIVHSLAVQTDRNIVVSASHDGSPDTYEIMRLIG